MTRVQTIAGFVALLWAIELLDVVLNHRLDGYGIEPRDPEGAVGIVFAPLLHVGWDHLLGNTFPIIVLGLLLLMDGVEHWLGVTAVIWLVGGVGVWLTAPENTLHLGASVLVFGWLTCLLVRGFVSGRGSQILIGFAVLFLYGGLLLGVLPGQPGISWQGHLFGAVGGVLAAIMLTDRARSAGRLTGRGRSPGRR